MIAIDIKATEENTVYLNISFGEQMDFDEEREKKNRKWFKDAIYLFYKELKKRPTTIHFLIDTVPPL